MEKDCGKSGPGKHENHDCDEAITNLYLFLDNEMNEDEALDIAKHIGDCSSCGDAYHFEDHLRRVIREKLCEEVSDEMMDRIKQAIHKR